MTFLKEYVIRNIPISANPHLRISASVQIYLPTSRRSPQGQNTTKLQATSFLSSLELSMPLPLPKDPQLDSDGNSLWQLIPSAEEAASNTKQPCGKYNNTLIAARVVGWFLKDIWEHQFDNDMGLIPYRYILRDLMECNSPQKPEDQHRLLHERGHFYRNNLLRVCRRHAGRANSDSEPSPDGSQSTSRPSLDQIKNSIIEKMAETPKTQSEVKTRVRSLIPSSTRIGTDRCLGLT